MKNRALDELIENLNKFESEESPTERIQKKRAAALAIVNDYIEKARTKELSEFDTWSMINSPLHDLINYDTYISKVEYGVHEDTELLDSIWKQQ